MKKLKFDNELNFLLLDSANFKKTNSSNKTSNLSFKKKTVSNFNNLPNSEKNVENISKEKDEFEKNEENITQNTEVNLTENTNYQEKISNVNNNNLESQNRLIEELKHNSNPISFISTNPYNINGIKSNSCNNINSSLFKNKSNVLEEKNSSGKKMEINIDDDSKFSSKDSTPKNKQFISFKKNINSPNNSVSNITPNDSSNITSGFKQSENQGLNFNKEITVFNKRVKNCLSFIDNYLTKFIPPKKFSSDLVYLPDIENDERTKFELGNR